VTIAIDQITTVRYFMDKLPGSEELKIERKLAEIWTKTINSIRQKEEPNGSS